MSYQLIPNLLFIFAVLGIVLIILRHLPEAVAQQQHEDPSKVLEKLSEKGLPAMAISSLKSQAKLWGNRAWHFMLEAKDLKPTAVAGYKIKKIFGKQAASVTKPAEPVRQAIVTDVKNEDYYLEGIKRNPKNLVLYHELGKYYLDHGSTEDAKDIYQYLVKHDPTNAEYFSKLAQCYFKLKEYAKAVENYDKSLSLDSTQPNRLYNRGICLEILGKFKEAVESFENAINLESQNPKFYIAAANAYLRLGNRNNAKVALRNAKRLDPENLEINDKLRQL